MIRAQLILVKLYYCLIGLLAFIRPVLEGVLPERVYRTHINGEQSGHW
jgi:hypothetical protein